MFVCRNVQNIIYGFQVLYVTSSIQLLHITYIITFNPVWKKEIISSLFFIKLFLDTCFFEDTVYPGTHIQSSPLTTNDPASCQKECQKDDQCQYWSFNTGNGGCKLLAELAAPESSAGGITSGPKFCPGSNSL